MSQLVQSFVRRAEKLVTSRSTVPASGSNSVDDVWLDTDLYVGEFAVYFTTGSLFTTDGNVIVELGKENAILSGMGLTVSGGTRKVGVTTGSIRIYGTIGYYDSTGTDITISANTGSTPILYFIYAQLNSSFYGATGNGNRGVSLSTVSISGTASSFFGSVVNSIGATVPDNSVMLGSVMIYPSDTQLYPVTYTYPGDYFPKFSMSPSQFLRYKSSIKEVYTSNRLYFQNQFLLEATSGVLYQASNTFVSNSSSINNDIASGYVSSLSGGSTGGTGSSTGSNIGSGPVAVFKQVSGSQFQFRNLTGSTGIGLTYSASGNDIVISVDTSNIASGGTNVGSGPISIYKGFSGGNLQIRSLTAASSRISITNVSDTIIIDVPVIGTTAQGVSLGLTSHADVYAGMSGNNLSFRRFTMGTGMTAVQGASAITISTTAESNDGTNIGGGPGYFYSGKTGSSLQFRSLTGGGIISVSTVGDLIVVTATGPSAALVYGTNSGATGSTIGQVFIGTTGTTSTTLAFRSLLAGTGISLSTVSNDIYVTSTITNGPQGYTGPQGFRGFQGYNGTTGSQGNLGPTGPMGSTGSIGPSGGPAGPTGYQGVAGPQGNTGSGGITGLTADILTTQTSGVVGATVVAIGGKPISLGGGLTFSGAFNTTFVTKFSGQLTLPGATSTLVASNLGITGGTTIIGGLTANDSLTLEGTSHSTKTTSYINLQTTGGLVGIGLTAPSATLHIGSSANDQLKLQYGITGGTAAFNVSISGDLSITPSGTYIAIGTKILTETVAGSSYLKFNTAASDYWAPYRNLTLQNQLGGTNVTLIIAGSSGSTQSANLLNFTTKGATVLSYIDVLGNFGIHMTSSGATAYLQIGAGTTSSPPIRLTSGPLATGTGVTAGNLEYLTDKLYFTIATGASVKEIALTDEAMSSGRIAFTTTNGRLKGGTVTAPLIISGTNLSIPLGNNDTNGYLAYADWNTFNNKPTNQFPSFTSVAYNTVVAPSNSNTLNQHILFTGSVGGATADLQNITSLYCSVTVSDFDRISSTSNIVIDAGTGRVIVSQAGSSRYYTLNLNGGSVTMQLVDPNSFMVI